AGAVGAVVLVGFAVGAGVFVGFSVGDGVFVLAAVGDGETPCVGEGNGCGVSVACGRVGSFVGCDVGATVWVAATVGVELPPFESSRVMTMAAATPPADRSHRPPKSAASAHPEADPPELGACRATRAVGFRRTIGVATV